MQIVFSEPADRPALKTQNKTFMKIKGQLEHFRVIKLIIIRNYTKIT